MDEIKVEQAIKSFSEKELGDIKVLMVEDDHFLSELVLTKLSQSGCIPYSTPNGEEAIELAEQYSPHVIILDLMLPKMSGEEVLKQLKLHETLKATPVIVFSNKDTEQSIKKVLELGADEYLVKSGTDLSLLPGIIKKLIAKS